MQPNRTPIEPAGCIVGGRSALRGGAAGTGGRSPPGIGGEEMPSLSMLDSGGTDSQLRQPLVIELL